MHSLTELVGLSALKSSHFRHKLYYEPNQLPVDAAHVFCRLWYASSIVTKYSYIVGQPVFVQQSTSWLHQRRFVRNLGDTREPKSAPSSPSRSPTSCRLNTSHLASRVSQGEPG
jgi:hypothetical protein